MAWVTGSGKSTGDLIDAAEWNQTVVANEAVLKTAINNAGHVSFVNASELTIASGAVTATQNYHAIDTESDAGSDDLDTVTAGASVVAGHVLALFAAHTARTVVLKDGTGNLNLDGSDITLSSDEQAAVLVFDGTNWRAVARPSAAATFAGLSPLSTRGDTLVASSGVVTGTRLAIGGANTVLTSDGTDAAWTAPGGAVDVFDVTLLNATSTGDTVIGTFTIPTWADKEEIRISVYALKRNNSGSTRITKLKLGVGDIADLEISAAGLDWYGTSSEAKAAGSIVLRRVGSNVWLIPLAASGGDAFNSVTELMQQPSAGDTVTDMGAPSSFSNIVIDLIINLAATDATYYFKPQSIVAERVTPGAHS